MNRDKMLEWAKTVEARMEERRRDIAGLAMMISEDAPDLVSEDAFAVFKASMTRDRVNTLCDLLKQQVSDKELLAMLKRVLEELPC